MPTSITLLGATGSIGSSVLKVLREFPSNLKLRALSAYGSDPKKLENIISEFSPECAHVFNVEIAKMISQKYPHTKVVSGKNGYEEIIDVHTSHIVVNALADITGVDSSLLVLKKKKKLILANKESLVMAGEKLMRLSQKNNIPVYPLDSEQTALWEILQKNPRKKIKKVYLPCSGGPFVDAKQWPDTKLKTVEPHQALQHPVWNMGPKISIDSATLMNKAFEIISLVRLFGISQEKIEVVIHPEGRLHAAVEFENGSLWAHRAPPDMKIFAKYALFEGKKSSGYLHKMDSLDQIGHLFLPDEGRFPSLQLARKALKRGEQACAELCQKNTEAVQKFLNGKITFAEIFEYIA